MFLQGRWYDFKEKSFLPLMFKTVLKKIIPFENVFFFFLMVIILKRKYHQYFLMTFSVWNGTFLWNEWSPVRKYATASFSVFYIAVSWTRYQKLRKSYQRGEKHSSFLNTKYWFCFRLSSHILYCGNTRKIIQSSSCVAR